MKIILHCDIDDGFYSEHSGTIPTYRLKEDEEKK